MSNVDDLFDCWLIHQRLMIKPRGRTNFGAGTKGASGGGSRSGLRGSGGEVRILEWKLDFLSLGPSANELVLVFGLDIFVFRQPPPIRTLQRTPPLVQYLRQLLQKWDG
ncbi:Uncharacterized protein Fot_17486 [Forsythia ovata]|uniref:Uncharacterized protein n=1 Tax=Forsythia ovata TaxID=205694 RepID=A0ABD1VFH2_9LAMI